MRFMIISATFVLTACDLSGRNHYTEQRQGYICRQASTAGVAIEYEYSYAKYFCWDSAQKEGEPTIVKEFSRCRMTERTAKDTNNLVRATNSTESPSCSITREDGTVVSFTDGTGGKVSVGDESLGCQPVTEAPHSESVSDTQNCSYGAPTYDEAFRLSPGPTCWTVDTRIEYVGASSKKIPALAARCDSMRGFFDTTHDIDGGKTLRLGIEVPIPDLPGVVERRWNRLRN